VHERSAAERLAAYAAQCGFEAAILQSPTSEILLSIAQAVVDRQDTHWLPTLRYLPADYGARAATRIEGEAKAAPQATELRAAYQQDAAPDQTLLDARRLALELGPGGDVGAGEGLRTRDLSFPHRMDVLRVWLRLHQAVQSGRIGGNEDGAPEAPQSDEMAG
jgi:hypothetical protein